MNERSITVHTLEAIRDVIRREFPECEVRRAYMPEMNLEKLEKLGKTLITVMPNDRYGETVGRGNLMENEFSFDIAIQKIVRKTNEDIDPCLLVTERIFDLFAVGVSAGFDDKQIDCHDPEHGELPFVATKAIKDEGHFLSAMSVKARVVADAWCGNQNDDGNE